MLKKRRNILFAVGIDKYESTAWNNLTNAVFDTKEIIKVLSERYSFEIYPEPIFDNNATRPAILNSLIELKQFIEPEDNIIIFFAGHGQMNPQTHRGYWVPHEGTVSLST